MLKAPPQSKECEKVKQLLGLVVHQLSKFAVSFTLFLEEKVFSYFRTILNIFSNILTALWWVYFIGPRNVGPRKYEVVLFASAH